jgi:hypothetical protein
VVSVGLTACAVLAGAVVWASWPDLLRAAHLCPYPDDPRSYAREGCGLFAESDSNATTLSSALSYYRVPMPADAQDVRFYLDPGAFNGGDTFFLHFDSSPAQVAAFLAQLHPQPSRYGAESSWSAMETEYQDPVPWSFADSARYPVYTYEVQVGDSDDRETDSGEVIIDTQSDPRAVYLYVGS